MYVRNKIIKHKTLQWIECKSKHDCVAWFCVLKVNHPKGRNPAW